MARADDSLAVGASGSAEKEMSVGALIFAINNEGIDYLRMAAWSAERIHRHLDIPVCVVTDANTRGMKVFDRVLDIERYEHDTRRYFEDLDASVTWYNHNRCDANLFTPWRQTLVLDADYVVASDQLRLLLDSSEDFLCHRWAYDVAARPGHEDLNYFGRVRMPMSWATVMMFRKGAVADQVFGIMNMVKENWVHYKDLYGINSRTYRNDHALSIALNILSGHTGNQNAIAWNLASVMPDSRLSQISDDHFRVDYRAQDGRARWVDIADHDFHAMGKKHLGDIIASTS
jgi:hypothetical protein